MKNAILSCGIVLSMLTCGAIDAIAQTKDEIARYVEERSRELWGIYFKEKVDSTTTAQGQKVRHGAYTMEYKGKVVEKGRYDKGKKVGKWEYRNYRDMLELRYDYNLGKPIYVLPHEGHKYDKQTNPCIFLGSPVVPYYFIMANVFYPEMEADNKHGGDVTLTISVNAKGRMTGYKIKKSSSPHFAKAVEKAADRIPRNEWQWVPAREKGKNVQGEYDIVIYFDN